MEISPSKKINRLLLRMQFSIGTRVKLKHTGDEGQVRKLLEDDLVMVFLDSIELEIPIPQSDLEIIEKLPEKDPLSEEKNASKTVQATVSTTENAGVLLAFEPILKKTGEPERFLIYFVNDLEKSFAYDIEFYLLDNQEEHWTGIVEAKSYQELGEIFYGELSDFPTFKIECLHELSDGTAQTIDLNIRLKPQKLFKKAIEIPLLHKKMHWRALFADFENEQQKEETDLKNYTLQKARPIKKRPATYRKYNFSNPQEYAEFDPVIDLHIENLSHNFGKMSNSEIMKIQLDAFEVFLAKAIRLGVPQIFVIHGLGKGRLKNEIALRLKNNPEVVNFKNEYHHKFGWGATEVSL